MKTYLSSIFTLASFLMVGCAATEGTDASSAEADVTAPSSAYTSLESKDCRDLPTEGPQEVPYGREICSGMSGYDLLVEDFDARNNVQVKVGGRTIDLDVWGKLPAFSHLGPKAEWRGPVVSPGVVNPYALIFRFFRTDGEGREKSYLVVSRITKDAACIVDTVDGGQANANERARQIADGAKSFQCPGTEQLEEATSIFTSLDNCSVIEQGKDGEDWARLACKGTGGYAVERQEGDLRSNVVVKHGNASSDLELWSVGTGGFSHLGPNADWRVSGADKKVHGLIFRYFQMVDEKDENNWLLVNKVSGNKACIVDIIDAKKHPNANVLAHEAADAAATKACPAQTPAAH